MSRIPRPAPGTFFTWDFTGAVKLFAAEGTVSSSSDERESPVTGQRFPARGRRMKSGCVSKVATGLLWAGADFWKDGIAIILCYTTPAAPQTLHRPGVVVTCELPPILLKKGDCYWTSVQNSIVSLIVSRRPCEKQKARNSFEHRALLAMASPRGFEPRFSP